MGKALYGIAATIIKCIFLFGCRHPMICLKNYATSEKRFAMIVTNFIMNFAKTDEEDIIYVKKA